MLKLKEYKKDIFYIFLLFIITIFTFYKIIFLKKIFYGSELITYYYPYYFYISECLKEKIFPLWSPYIFCGHPVFAVGNTGVLYPFNLLFFYFPSLYLFSCIVSFHFFLAGAGMYIFSRVLGLKYFSSFLSSLTFMFCRFFLFYLHAPSYIHSTAWLPIVFAFLELYFKKNNFSFLFFAILFLTVQFFGGDASLNLISLFFIFFYFLFKFITTPEKLRLTSGYLILIFGSVCLFSVQLLPLQELNKLSFRYFAEFKEMTEGSLRFRELLNFLFLPIFSVGNISEYKMNFYIDEKFTLFIITSTFFAFLSIIMKDKLTRFLIIMNILSLLCVLGENTFVFRILWHLPFYNSIRYPIKFIYIYFFTFSLLVGLCVNYLLNLDNIELKKKIIRFCYGILFFYLFIFGLVGWWSYSEEIEYFNSFISYLISKGYLIFIFIFISFSLLILYIKGKISKRNFKYLIFVIFIFSLFFNPINKIPEYKGEYFFPENDISENLFLASSDISIREVPEFVNFLKKDKDLYRIYPYEKYLFLSNIFSFYKIQSMFGYSAQEMKDHKDFLSILQEKNLFGLLNVKYILFPSYLEFFSEDWELVFDKNIRIFKNKKFLPRVFFVKNVKVIKERNKILEELKKDNFSKKEYIILEEKPEIYRGQMEKDYEIKRQNIIKKIVTIVKYKHQEVIIKANLNTDGFLVLSDTYYPGWKVYVNGKEDKIYRANYLFRAIYLKKGEHKIKFMYEPLSFKIGLIISVFTLFILVIILSIVKIKNCKKL